jgi:hypothetical protein
MSRNDPEPELQKAVIAKLLAFTPLTAIVGTRIWDKPPSSADPTFPYVTLGESQVLPQNGDCYRAAEANFVIHGWTRQTTREQAKRIGAQISAALDGEEDGLFLATHSVVACDFIRSDVFLDEDGKTQRVAVRFRALTEPVTE